MTRTSGRRVAVIGSGLAGLTAAYLLRQEGAEVWLIEKAGRLGFHSQSVDIELEDIILSQRSAKQPNSKKSPKWVVDVPMRSFQGGYYPLLIALYRHLRIPLVPTYYTFSFSRLTATNKTEPYFIHTGASGSAIPSLPSRAYASITALTSAIRHFIGVVAAYFIWVVIAALGWHGLIPRHTTLRRLTETVSLHLTYPLSYFSNSLPKSSRLSTSLGIVFTAFIYDIILPLFSAVGTMSTTDVLNSPVGSLLDYVHSTMGTSHFTLATGNSAGTVAGRLAKEVERQGDGYLRLGEEVLDMEYDGRVKIKCRSGEILVDQVVVATQASAAAVILGMLEASLSQSDNNSERQRISGMRNALREVEYRETIVVTHRDWSILPNKSDQREINLTTPVDPLRPGEAGDNTPPLSASSGASSPSSSMPNTPPPGDPIPFFPPQPDCVYSMGTHIIQPPSYLRDAGIDPVLQTTNPVCAINAETVLAVSRMERALPLRDTTIFGRLHPESPQDSIPALVYLAGSYAYPGIPLLEGCVGSAIKVCSSILQTPPRGLGGVNWDTGRGGRLGRIWRWRRDGIVPS